MILYLVGHGIPIGRNRVIGNAIDNINDFLGMNKDINRE